MPTSYGEPRDFVEGTNRVTAVPFMGNTMVETVAPDAKIERVVIVKMDGDRPVIERMAAGIKKTYAGALYSTWQLGNAAPK